jgi:hypothetical protein
VAPPKPTKKSLFSTRREKAKPLAPVETKQEEGKPAAAPLPKRVWKHFTPKARTGLVTLGTLIVDKATIAHVQRADTQLVTIRNNLVSLLMALEEGNLTEVKDEQHYIPEKAGARTSLNHQRSEDKAEAKASNIIIQMLDNMQAILPFIVAAGKARWRARVNGAKYLATEEAELERRTDYKEGMEERRRAKKRRFEDAMAPAEEELLEPG